MPWVIPWEDFSKVNNTDLAYIAGFLDGDGSIMLQFHRRDRGKEIFRIKTVICFYQDNRYLSEIKWIQQIFNCGYVYTRNDRICELRIEGYQRVFDVLMLLRPYLRLKRKQAELLIDLIPQLQRKLVSKQDIVVWIQKMRELNYFSSQRNTLENVPVTTDMDKHSVKTEI
ncbi:MAG TPA: LAGLIDADG family homing endonuclease [Methylomirabilota bacterium]|nr:LAGLIDADG family homing endonuclease [Methylomirabilota bacterium]